MSDDTVKFNTGARLKRANLPKYEADPNSICASTRAYLRLAQVAYQQRNRTEVERNLDAAMGHEYMERFGAYHPEPVPMDQLFAALEHAAQERAPDVARVLHDMWANITSTEHDEDDPAETSALTNAEPEGERLSAALRVLQSNTDPTQEETLRAEATRALLDLVAAPLPDGTTFEEWVLRNRDNAPASLQPEIDRVLAETKANGGVMPDWVAALLARQALNVIQNAPLVAPMDLHREDGPDGTELKGGFLVALTGDEVEALQANPNLLPQIIRAHRDEIEPGLPPDVTFDELMERVNAKLSANKVDTRWGPGGSGWASMRYPKTQD